ncbi:dihydroxyacetone kinase subunit DhaL [Nocardiopsis halotolerans]|uniref:dihydroxyacetone kinase subunit DhaL n=1 Tax=Nocardiopsis halotolerans TaxID=124252 RepID=UPI00034B2B74|nr:dihydroxyacetone kinase subunit DhaL [Nocardiopsis halotolerans]
MAEQLSPSHVQRWVDGFVDTVVEKSDYLTDLDRRSGDGDFGTNMVTALRRSREAMAGAEATAAGTLFQIMSETFLTHSGGTSGPLFGMWFRDFGKVGADAGGFTLAMLDEATRKGWTTVTRLGSASVGDRTMVDAIAPASDALTAAVGAGSGLEEGLRAAASAAREGAEETSELVGRRGRTSYVGASALGIPDPGAVTIALFYRAAQEAVGA